jgi:hypothetical protein
MNIIKPMKRIKWPYMLILLSGLFAFNSCGANKRLTGIWQQVIDENDQPMFLYEIHLAHFGSKVTGLLLRYQTPQSTLLSLFDRADRCGCFYLIQGSYQDDLSKVVFRIFEPQVQRSTEEQPSCSPQPDQYECERIFELVEEDGILKGKSWCIGQSEQGQKELTFEATPGVTENECQVISDQGIENGNQ